MKTINLKGMGVAMVTPFDKEGNVDYQALSHLIDIQLQSGTDYLVALGTTAETPTLMPEEQCEILRLITTKAEGKIPVIMGLGGNNTRALVNKLQNDDFTGVSAILSVNPYYNKPTQEGLYQHFKQIAQASPLPVILYNIPGRCGVNMTAETTLRLARDFENIVGIKEASGNMEQIREIIKNKPDSFQVISGDDGITFELIKSGGVGVISVIANALPKEYGTMVRLALAGDYEKAQAINESFGELFKLLCVDGNPAGVKCLLAKMGLIENELRLPLTPVSAATEEQLSVINYQLSVISKQ